MACVTVTIAEAVVVTIAEKIAKKKEQKSVVAEGATVKVERSGLTLSKRLSVLKKMLWGGSALLLFEHIWHGEIVPFFPFFTAASSPDSLAEMLNEMATTGVIMSVAVTALWGVIMLMMKSAEKSQKQLKPAEDAQ